MKIIYNNIIPFKGFTAINLFGVLFVRANNRIDKYIINHETIHTRQIKELFYFPFYIIYFLEWIVRMIQKRDFYKAYRAISFEKEAYENESDLNYLKNRKACQWIKYWIK